MNVRRTIYSLGILLMLISAGAGTSAADCGYSQVLRAHLMRQRKMLIAIVETMPEDKYDFRPTKDVRSFREMVEHLIGDTYLHAGFVMGKTGAESRKAAEQNGPAGKTRAEYLKALAGAFDYGDKILGEITDQNAMETVSAMRGEKVTRVEAALDLFEDQMDHYGNFVVYVRMNGIVPPDTAARQQQRKEQLDHDHQ